MKQKEKIRPFEINPEALKPGAFEIVQPEPDGSLPAPLAPADVVDEPRRRPWLKLFLGGAAAFALGVLGLDAYDYAVSLFERSVWLGGAFSARRSVLLAWSAASFGASASLPKSMTSAPEVRA